VVECQFTNTAAAIADIFLTNSNRLAPTIRRWNVPNAGHPDQSGSFQLLPPAEAARGAPLPVPRVAVEAVDFPEQVRESSCFQKVGKKMRLARFGKAHFFYSWTIYRNLVFDILS
jgi:hypothetical protein